MWIDGFSRLSGLALVAALAMTVASTDAMAWSYGSWGSSGSYGSSGSIASYGSYGSYGRVGLFPRIRARRAARRASYYYGSYGFYGSSASYGSYGSSGSYGAVIYRETVVVSATTGKTSIKVAVPEGAKVYVNDLPTTSTGVERSYVSRGLRQGMTYSYKIHVEYEKNGQTVSEEKLVELHGGDTVLLTFGQAEEDATAEAQATEPVETEVKVQVPDDASVFLSGSPTKQTGTLRIYSTTQLAAGHQWEDYTVRVEADRNGQTVVREKKLTIEGGGSYELAFHLDLTATAQLAQSGK